MNAIYGRGEQPGGRGYAEFTRETAVGAVFKATDLIDEGWTDVHICDRNSKSIGLMGFVS